ncbi:MAG: phage holin family protein [Leucobacter sp.]
MVRFLINVVVQFALAAIALLIAAWAIDGVTVRVGGFFIAVGVFAVAQAILAPFVFNLARKYASAILGGIGLISTFLALWVATLFGGGLSIHGVASWIAAPLLVWIITALGTWLLGAMFIEKWLEKRKARK